MGTYTRLLSPIRVGGMELKNRIAMVAMHHLYTEDGLPTPRFTAYYKRRAEGGAGLITVGACRFDEYGAHASTMSLAEDGCIGPWRAFTDEMHETDCRVAVQLYHAGRYLRRDAVPADDEALAPSAVYTPFTRETARAMTEEDIRRVIDDWAEGAWRAKAAGFDAVEISGSAGYLICQFLAPLTNRREDEYGGSRENRMRFPLAVIRAVRQAVGEGYPVILRMAGHDLVRGACTNEDAVAFAAEARRAGVDLLSVTGGWHESRVPQLTEDLPPGGLAYLSAAIKEAVDIPVAMANRLGDPDVAERVLALEQADIIGMGRPLLADPDLPKKLMAGEPEAIRPCVACNQGCLAGTFFGKPIRCLANGQGGREYLLCKPKTPSQRILVVGGGPAGCTYALEKAEQGHRVTLMERENQLGGQLRLAAKLPSRSLFGDLVRYYEQALPRAGVEVVLGREAGTADRLGFDRVVIATGRRPKAPELPVEPDAVPVWTAYDVLEGRVEPGRRLVVVGGSFVGCETARLLARQGSLSPEQLYYLTAYGVEPGEKVSRMLNGSRRQITLVDRGKLGTGYEPGVAWTVLGDLKRLGVETMKNTQVLRVDADGVQVSGDGVERHIPCDGVVMAVGTRPENPDMPGERLGNVRHLGRALDAVSAAVELAWGLDGGQ